jgi:cytochrome c-type biogenesis protein CcmE
MDRSLRRRHARLWLLLAPVLVVGIIMLIALRPDWSQVDFDAKISPQTTGPGAAP